MKRYPKYKDSGIDWLGEIPEHWEVRRLKYIIVGKLKYGANEEAFLEDRSFPRYIRITDFDNKGKLRNDTFKSLNFSVAKDYLLSEGDILFAISGATVGKTFQFKNYQGQACFAGYLIKAVPKTSVVTSDYLYLFTKSGIYDFWKTIIFNQATIQNIGADKYSCLLVPVPPLEEQNAIACFIDRKLVQIDQFISNKQRFIELLKEQKSAIVNRAVTKGLNPDAPMKPSGIEWLGDIPEGWEVRKLKRSINRIEQGWSPLCHNELAAPEQWGVLKVGAVNGGIFRESENKALPNNLEPINHYEIKEGDVLISRANTRELLGSAAVVQQVRPKLILCDKLYRVKLKDEVLSKYYLIYMLVTRFSRYQMESAATGSSDSMQNISQETIKDLKILLPPIAEQNAITTYINDELVKINQAIAKAEKEIELIQEYRTTLISDAVTGKIDVREITTIA